MTVAGLIQEIFDEPSFKSDGTCSEFRLERRFDALHIRVVERDYDFMVLEVLNKSNRIGKITRYNYFTTLEDLDLHLRNIRKGYPSFKFTPKF